MKFERDMHGSRRLTGETKYLRHGYRLKNTGWSKVQRFPAKNPPKKAKKREPKRTRATKATIMASSRQGCMREREIGAQEDMENPIR